MSQSDFVRKSSKMRLKAPAKRSQRAKATCRNIVGRNIVARVWPPCCDMLGVVGWKWSKLSQQQPACRNTSQHDGQTYATCCAQQCCAQKCCDMFWSFGRGLTCVIVEHTVVDMPRGKQNISSFSLYIYIFLKHRRWRAQRTTTGKFPLTALLRTPDLSSTSPTWGSLRTSKRQVCRPERTYGFMYLYSVWGRKYISNYWNESFLLFKI